MRSNKPARAFTSPVEWANAFLSALLRIRAVLYTEGRPNLYFFAVEEVATGRRVLSYDEN